LHFLPIDGHLSSYTLEGLCSYVILWFSWCSSWSIFTDHVRGVDLSMGRYGTPSL
jgi:hypothetical protein